MHPPFSRKWSHDSLTTPLTTALLLDAKRMRKERKGETSTKMPFTIYFSQPEMPLDLPWKTYPRINPSHSGD